MHLTRKLFGEILPFRMNHAQLNVPLKGGLAWGDRYFPADRTILLPVVDDGLMASVSFVDPPPELRGADSAWFHDVQGLRLSIVLSEGCHYEFDVKVLETPDFFLNEAGRPEPHPPSRQSDDGPSYYMLEITDYRWWSSEERSDGHEWRFSVNDLPLLPSIRHSGLCQVNTVPGTYPGAYFTCTLNEGLHSAKPTEYWFTYELESSLDRSYHRRDELARDRREYRFSFGRTDKQELHVNEGHRILDLWEYLLGFCSGSFRRADIIIGYGDHGGWTYAELPSRFSRLTRQLPYRFSWFPQDWSIDFPALACQFLTCFQKDYDLHSKLDGVPVHFFNPALRISHGFGAAIPILEGYLRAAPLDIPHDALNAAFATLESEVKRRSNLSDDQHIPRGGISKFLRNNGIPPGERSRGFGSRENSSWQPVRDIAGLKEKPEGASSWEMAPDYKPDKTADPDDEEYGINYIRSWRDKRASHFDAHAGGGTFYDIQNYANLTLEYLELLVLKEMGYGELYRSRTGMFKQAVRTVPWGEKSDVENHD